MSHESAASLQRRADALLAGGRHAEAIAAYRQVLALEPTQPDAWYNLGYLLKADGRYDEALDAYGRALSSGVRRAEEVHLNRAVIYADHLRRDAEAESELRAALALHPGYAPALLNLGNLHEEKGEPVEAVACYERILSDDAGNGAHALEAIARMAHLRPPGRPDDPMLQRLQDAAHTAPDGDVRANLLFALGRACDRLGLHERAFDAFAQGNLCTRGSGPGYDRARVARRVDDLIAAFRTSPPDESGDDDSHPAPVFICGMFRSGSTLLEQVLGAHPRITAGGELDYLRRLVAGPLAPFPASMAVVDADRDAALARGYRAHLARLFPHAAGDAYVTDKRPDNFLLIGLILRMFPRARIIHTTRHPLDNGLSVFMQHLDPGVAAYASDLRDIGHYYGEYRRLMAHWKSLHGDRILDFDYDGFVAEPRPAVERVLRFLELEWDERCLQFHQQRNTVKTASYWQVRRPLYGEATGRWRKYAAQLEPLRRALLAAGVDPD